MAGTADIPSDIEQAATRFAGKYLAHDISCERLYRDAAALVMAERERCAKIAETMPETVLQFWDRPGGPPGNGYRPTTYADIAASIRQP